MCLTEKQKRFIDEYLIDLNATQAAIRAGYSENTAYRIGFENLNKPQIQCEIQEAFKKRAEKVELKQIDVIKGLMQLAYSDIRKIATWNDDGVPQFKPSSELDDNTAMSIKSITFTERHFGEGNVERRLKVEQYDKKSALDSLAKHLGMFNPPPEKNDQSNEPPRSDFSRIFDLAGVSRTKELEFSEASNN